MPDYPIPSPVLEICDTLEITVIPLSFSIHLVPLNPLEGQLLLGALQQHIKKYSYYHEMAVDIFRGDAVTGGYIGRVRLDPTIIRTTKPTTLDIE